MSIDATNRRTMARADVVAGYARRDELSPAEQAMLDAVRDEVRARIPNFVEVHVHCPIEVLADRDVKGLYKRALAGEIPHFTGISDPYEPPLSPEVTVNSAAETPEQSVEKIWATLERLGLVSLDRSSLAHQ